jgi:hypothetical protein
MPAKHTTVVRISNLKYEDDIKIKNEHVVALGLST